MIKGVIYDMDGIMVNSEPISFKSMEETLNSYGLSLHDMPQEMKSGFIGRRIVDIIADIKEFFKMDETIEDIFKKREGLFFGLVDESLEMKPGLKESLSFFKNKGFRIALSSSGTSEYISKVIEKFSLRDYFDVIISGDDVTKGKPDPEPFVVTSKKLGLSPPECIVLEDAKHGVESAKGAGCFCIGIPDTSSRRIQDLSKADIVIKSLNEINEELIKKIEEKVN